MPKYSSAKHHQKNKGKLKKKLIKDINLFLNEKKIKSHNLIMNYKKIYQKMKSKTTT